ncbi:unnamed protein product, partial [Mesorhabditis belari]|uniref:Uncharacterized protein n=1 Tax=Mesorhabditis belari TaxID=2138241 RepID=A0AAF3F1U2_9BILA
MNIDFVERNFGAQYPEEHDCTIDLQGGNANCCKFNRWGSLVAVGTTDGRMYIVDFVTKGIAKTWTAHVQPIMALSWSRDGRKLLTGSADSTVVVWDVLTTTALQKYKYSAIVVSALFNPRNDLQIVVLPLGMWPVSESISPTGQPEHAVVSYDIPGAADDGVTAIAFDRRGKYLITGTSKGRLCIFDAQTLRIVTYVKQNSQQQIRNIVIPRRYNQLITNTSDRIIRCFDFEDLLVKPKGAVVDQNQKLLDIVNKAAWKAVCVSPEGEYICGGSTKAHSLHIWERNSGSLVKIVHGTKGESLHDVQWHPTRPIILSVANGIVSVWTQVHVENWSAFAPEFTELEENAKYIEKEGEFDLEDEDADEENNDDGQDKREEAIDICGLRSNDIVCSSDEEDDPGKLIPDPTGATGPLWYVPTVPEIENPECGLAHPGDLLHRPSSQMTNPSDDQESRKRGAPATNLGSKPKKPR